MYDIMWKAVLTLLVAVIFGAGPGGEFKLEEGFALVFNGKDFTGWAYHAKQEKINLDGKTETHDKRIEIMDGIMVINAKGKEPGNREIHTTKSYDKDFHLKLEFRASPKSDSGVYLRGKQLQVRDYPTMGPYKNLKNFKDGDWNVLEVVVKDNVAVCTCNGELMTNNFKVPASGGIGMQAEIGKFEYRRVRIQEL